MGTPIIFGTDGWRGIIGEELTASSVGRVGQAFAGYLNERGMRRGVAVGFDGRAFSRGFAVLFARVLSANGIPVVRSDVVIPTPVLSWNVVSRSLDAGVMLTASHNPPTYNGVKFKAKYGGPFVTEETHAVEELLDRTPVRMGGSPGTAADFLTPYLEKIEQLVRFDVIRNSGVRVVVDSMHGAGGRLLETVLRRNDCDARTIGDAIRTDFGGRSPEPIEKNLAPLAEALAGDPHASLGVATDGDADRLGVLMDGGEWLSAQEAIVLLTDYLVHVRQMPGNIVKTASVTDKVRTLFAHGKRRVHDVQVGFKYITERMVSEHISIGCEESGGYGFGVHLPERDGILSALFLIELLAHSGFHRFHEYVNVKRKEIGTICYDRIDLAYHADDRLELLPRLQRAAGMQIGGFAVREVLSYESSRGIINGLKYICEGDCRWLLLRASETEPLVRIYSEGNTMDEVRTLLHAGMHLLTADVR